MIKQSLFASEEREHKLNKLGDLLDRLNDCVNFSSLSAELERIMPRSARLKGGRPPFPTELMVRILVIQQLYNLSDDQMEFQLLDRLSLQRFAGLRHSSQIPDAKTIWLFKERLKDAGAHTRLFDLVGIELARHGYIARGGQMIDASLVQVPRQHLSREEKAILEAQAIPTDWKPSQRQQKDTQAKWTQKHGKSYFGYKLSANVDKQYKLIRKVKISPANEHDTLHLEAILDPCNTCQAIYADKGYVDQAREQRLIKSGIKVHIQRKAKRGQVLSECQRKRNTRIARVRARVEHPFAAMAQMGGKTLRIIGLARAKFQLHLKAACYNLWRLVSLKKHGIKAI